MKKFGIVSILLAGMLCVPSASALVSDFTLPSNNAIKVTVESTVTENPGSEYLYTYQISNIGDLNISLLSIPFLTPLADGTIYDFTYSGSPVPVFWEPIGDSVGDSAIAAQAYFTSSPSALTLEFKSIYSEQTVEGHVDDVQLGSLYGDLIAPVPEPLTISLFAIGAGMIVRKKHKKKSLTHKHWGAVR